MQVPQDGEEFAGQPQSHGPLSHQKAGVLLSATWGLLGSCPWFHGGHPVISGCWQGSALSFEILCVALHPQPGQPTVLFQLEDECFPSLPSLDLTHVTSQHPQSQAIGAGAFQACDTARTYLMQF